jgi:hypothetical protein
MESQAVRKGFRKRRKEKMNHRVHRELREEAGKENFKITTATYAWNISS